MLFYYSILLRFSVFFIGKLEICNLTILSAKVQIKSDTGVVFGGTFLLSVHF